MLMYDCTTFRQTLSRDRKHRQARDMRLLCISQSYCAWLKCICFWGFCSYNHLCSCDCCVCKCGESSTFDKLDIEKSGTHYGDVIMDAIASQITSLTIVYSIVYSDADQRKHQSSKSPAFVRGIHRGPVNSPHKWPVTRKMFPFDGVTMTETRGKPSPLHPEVSNFNPWCRVGSVYGLTFKFLKMQIRAEAYDLYT